MPIKAVVEELKHNTETGKKQPQILENVPLTKGKPRETGMKQKTVVLFPLYLTASRNKRTKQRGKREIFLIEHWAA